MCLMHIREELACHSCKHFCACFLMPCICINRGYICLFGHGCHFTYTIKMTMNHFLISVSEDRDHMFQVWNYVCKKVLCWLPFSICALTDSMLYRHYSILCCIHSCKLKNLSISFCLLLLYFAYYFNLQPFSCEPMSWSRI